MITEAASTSEAAIVQFGTVPSTIDHCTFASGLDAIQMQNSTVTVRDSQFVNISRPIYLDGSLTMDRVSIRGGFKPIYDGGTNPSNHVDLSNLLVFDTSDGMHLEHAAGSVSFSTFGYTQSGATPLYCNSSITLTSSIVWNPAGQTVSGACSIKSSIIGPGAVLNVPSSDPKFANSLQGDFHPTSSSPAVDLVDSGPATDLDGLMRPQGPRLDIGAFEYKP